MSIYNIISVSMRIPTIKELIATTNAIEDKPHLTMSKTGKNVVVICIDKAVDGFVPYIFNEKPELFEQYSGFVWYPNTISYGNMTNVGSPGLYGGYEYIPEEMNNRYDESLCKKQNEAVSLMPVLFNNIGYDVTVCDPPYAGYTDIPDLSIYDDYPDINAYLIDKGNMRENQPEIIEAKKSVWKRNFFCFSLMKIVPLVFQDSIYLNGTYYSSDADTVYSFEANKDIPANVGGYEQFQNAYSVLKQLPELTYIDDNNIGAFFMMHNTTTHSPIFLQEPDYIPALNVDNSKYETYERIDRAGNILHLNDENALRHYHANIASLIQIGIWLDYLKENDIYDNTKIIIVSDHGANLSCAEDLKLNNDVCNCILYFNPILLVKDFNSNFDFKTDYSFMTNADTPSIACENVIDNPINPFTGKIVNTNKKEDNEQHIFYTMDWMVEKNNGNTFIPGIWYSLRNKDIFNEDNWSLIND